MLQAKRLQFRKQIRQQKINSLFSIKRKCLLEGKNQMMKQIYEDVEGYKHGGQNVIWQMRTKLDTLLQHYQDNQNTYVIVGNYLLDHPEDYVYFLTKLFFPHYSEHQAWCLFLIATNLQKFIKQPNPQYETAARNIKEILSTMTQICRERKKKVKNIRISQNQEINIELYFIHLFKMQVNYSQKLQIGQYQIELFSQIVRQLVQSRQPEPQQIRIIWPCIQKILTKLSNIDSRQQIQQILTIVMKIIISTLKILPQQRQQCIDTLNRFIIRHPSEFHKFFYAKEFINQILYLLEEIPHLKCSIINLIIKIISSVSIQQLLLMLQMGLHTRLTNCLEWAISQGDNSCLEECLTAIYSLMYKIKNENELKILKKIMEDIQQLNFHLMIQGLAQNLQNQRIDHQLDQIIEEFYSQEDNLVL